MKTVLKTVLGLTAASVFWTSAASAAPIANPTELQSLLTSRTLYTEGFKASLNRSDQVRLSKNGTAQTDYTVYRHVYGMHTVPESGRTYGTWSIKGSQVCFQWRTGRTYQDRGAKSGCFNIERLPGKEFSTPNYRATNVTGGGYWDFRVID